MKRAESGGAGAVTDALHHVRIQQAVHGAAALRPEALMPAHAPKRDSHS